MAKLEYVRKNILTNEYEHLVQSTDGSNADLYWAPGMTGLDWLSNTQLVMQDVSRGTIPIQVRTNGNSDESAYSYYVSYEDYSKFITGDYINTIINNAIEWITYIETYDIGIRELQTNIKPKLTYIPESNGDIARWQEDGKLKLLFGTELNLQMDATNPIYDLDWKMNYKWLKDAEPIAQAKSITLGNSEFDTGVFHGEVENEAGITSTSKFDISIHDPRKTKKFYTNLIKNGDASEGTGRWNIITGRPEVSKIGNWPAQQSDMYYQSAFYKRTWLGSYGELHEPFGPFPSNVISGNPLDINDSVFYFRGGVAGQANDVNVDNFVTMKQDIDLSSVSDYIDRKIRGVDDVYGCLFGWLGNMGQGCGLREMPGGTNNYRPTLSQGALDDTTKEMTWSSLLAINRGAGNGWENVYSGNVLILDRVYIQVKMFNENDNEINCEYIMYSPLHMGEDFKFFLRAQHIYIPYGVRRLEIWVKFQRSDVAILKPFQIDANNASVSKFVRVGKWNNNLRAIEQVHTSALQNLNLYLYINNTDEFYNTIKLFNNSIHFRQYELNPNNQTGLTEDIITDSYMMVDGNYDMIKNHAKFIVNRFPHSASAIHLKVNDLYSINNIDNFNVMFNTISSIEWFSERFSNCMIWNSIIDAINEYNLQINLTGINRMNCDELYYDESQHYPAWQNQESSDPNSTNNEVDDGLLHIGDYYQGGFISYIFQPGDANYVSGEEHGLIISTTDLPITYPYIPEGYYVNGADGTTIGTGIQNTNDIMNTSVPASSLFAAKACDNYVHEGYSDWFLPSKDELYQAFISHPTSVPTPDIEFTNMVGNYWSSSKSQEQGRAWHLRTADSYLDVVYTSIAQKIRPMRKF